MDCRMPLVSDAPTLLPESADTDAGTGDWAHITATLNRQGSAVLPQLLSQQECETVVGMYPDARRFRSRVVMQRHGFGQGEYQYFSYPLPDIVAQLRATLYPRLVNVANVWNQAMGIDVRYPVNHADFLARCHAAGQNRPTPLLD